MKATLAPDLKPLRFPKTNEVWKYTDGSHLIITGPWNIEDWNTVVLFSGKGQGLKIGEQWIITRDKLHEYTHVPSGKITLEW